MLNHNRYPGHETMTTLNPSSVIANRTPAPGLSLRTGRTASSPGGEGGVANVHVVT